MFYRVAGAALLALSGGAGAYLMNRSASAALTQLEGWLTLLRYVKAQVDCFALPASAILAGCDPILLRACGYEGARLPKSFEELLRGCRVRDGGCLEILSRFAAEFGKSYREEQSRSCDYYLGLLSDRRAALSAALPGKKKRNSTLCISAALAAVILLI